jgi:hypothetical protein
VKRTSGKASECASGTKVNIAKHLLGANSDEEENPGSRSCDSESGHKVPSGHNERGGRGIRGGRGEHSGRARGGRGRGRGGRGRGRGHIGSRGGSHSDQHCTSNEDGMMVDELDLESDRESPEPTRTSLRRSSESPGSPRGKSRQPQQDEDDDMVPTDCGK